MSWALAVSCGPWVAGTAFAGGRTAWFRRAVVPRGSGLGALAAGLDLSLLEADGVTEAWCWLLMGPEVET